MEPWLTHLLALVGGAGGLKLLGIILEKWGPGSKDETKIVIQQPAQQLPPYKENFLEDLGALFRENTEILRSMRTEVHEMYPIVTAKDATTNFPHVWEDRKIHEEVKTIVTNIQSKVS